MCLCAWKQVPIHSLSTVMNEIEKHLFDQDVCSMISEKGVLASVQAVAAMLNSYVNIA